MGHFQKECDIFILYYEPYILPNILSKIRNYLILFDGLFKDYIYTFSHTATKILIDALST